MSNIPASAVSVAHNLARQDSAGKLAAVLGGSASTLAALGADALLPAAQAPAKAVYATGGAQALVPGDIGAQVSDATLTALAALTIAANKFVLGTGADAFTMQDITAFMVTFLGRATAAAARSDLALDTGNSPTFTDLTLSGNLFVQGTRTVISGERTALADNYIDLNAGYSADAAQSAGLVAVYDPTTTTTTVNGAYVAGVASTSNPTVGTTGAATFAAGDIVQFSGVSGGANQALFEVQSHAANVLTIKGIGTVAAVEDWSVNQFVAGSSDGATITKVNVAVIRWGTDGILEGGKGSTVPLTYTDYSSLSLGSAAPIVVDGGVAAAGSSGTPSRDDHKHAHGIITSGDHHQEYLQEAGGTMTGVLVTAGRKRAVRSVAGTTIVATDEIIASTPAGATANVLLPTSPAIGDSYTVTREVAGSFDVVVDAGSGKNINGAQTKTLLVQYETLNVTYVSANNWRIM